MSKSLRARYFKSRFFGSKIFRLGDLWQLWRLISVLRAEHTSEIVLYASAHVLVSASLRAHFHSSPISVLGTPNVYYARVFKTWPEN